MKEKNTRWIFLSLFRSLSLVVLFFECDEPALFTPAKKGAKELTPTVCVGASTQAYDSEEAVAPAPYVCLFKGNNRPVYAGVVCG